MPSPEHLRTLRIPAGRGSQAGSGLAVAIEGRRGPFAVLSLQSASSRAFTARDVDFVQSLANVLADALERQATEDMVHHRALHDHLTGLPNRVLFHDRIEQALVRLRRAQKLAAVLFLDLDRFKLVNDSRGHDAGDELLVAIVPRLQRALRASDTVARFGGDEFAILLEDLGTRQRDVIRLLSQCRTVVSPECLPSVRAALLSCSPVSSSTARPRR